MNWQTIKRFFRENPGMWLVSGASLAMLLFVVWGVYGGFSLQFSQFFAAAPHTASTLIVQCGTTKNVLTWTLPEGHDSNGLQRSVDGGSLVFLPVSSDTQTTYTDTDVSAGHTYAYRHKAFTDAVSNTVTCPAPTPTPTPSPTATATTSASPTASPTGTPTPTPQQDLECAPISQTAQVGQYVGLQSSGGSGQYQWTITAGGIQQGGSGGSVIISYSTIGTKSVLVESAGQSARCAVNIVSAGQASVLSINKTARNLTAGDASDQVAISVNPTEAVEFTTRIVDTGNDPIAGLMLVDQVPPGMSYQAGSTRVDGETITDDMLTTTGLSLGGLDAGNGVTVQWMAIADTTNRIAAGPNHSQPQASAIANGVSTVTSHMDVTVYGAGIGSTTTPTGGVSTVQTGPGDAVAIALAVAACLALLYGGYTRSRTYRTREANTISRDQGPLDFRS